MKLALDVALWTDEHARKAIAANLSDLQILFFFYLLLNQRVNSRVIHKFKISDAAATLHCKQHAIRSAIKALNAAGLTELEISNRKVSGSIIGSAKARLRQEEEGPYPLRVGKLHREAVKALFPRIHGNGTVKMQLILLLGLHCDEETGILHEKRPVEWGELLGDKCRVAVSRAFDFFNEAGINQTTTDYTVEGRLPFVQLAHNFFVIDKARRKHNKEASFTAQVKAQLYKYFGINAKGWLKEQLTAAYTELILPIVSGEVARC